MTTFKAQLEIDQALFYNSDEFSESVDFEQPDGEVFPSISAIITIVDGEYEYQGGGKAVLAEVWIKRSEVTLPKVHAAIRQTDGTEYMVLGIKDSTPVDWVLDAVKSRRMAP